MLQKNKRILALDLGDSWIGVAHTDLSQTIASPHTTWRNQKLITELEGYLKNNAVEKVIIGLPLACSNKHSEQTKKVIATKEMLEQKFSPIEFLFINERLSSKHAMTMIHFHDMPLKKKGAKSAQEHSISEHSLVASLLLQDYLNNTHHNNNN